MIQNNIKEDNIKEELFEKASEEIDVQHKTKESNTAEKNDESKKGAKKKIEVPYDIVADRIMRQFHIMTFDDTKELYVYDNGVYVLPGAETKIDLVIRDEYSMVYAEKWDEIYGTEPPAHIPKANGAFVKETMNYIKRVTAVFRSDIDNMYQHLINLENGMFDIDKWVLIPHDPKYRSIRQIPITYDPKAECPRIKKFLSDVVSLEDVDVLIEFSGYSLIPDTRIQKAVMLYGEGSNGKSIFLRLLIAFIGSENVSGVSLQKLETDKFAVANLYGKLLNVYPDLKDQTVYHSDIFKTLVGCDRVDGEKKFKDAFSFQNKARLIFSANKIPAVKNDGFAYFRRWILINFPNIFEEGKNDDKDLFEKLTTPEELSGFLNLALEGLKRVLWNRKYSHTKPTEDVTRLYKENSSAVSLFAESCLITSTEDTEKTDVHEFYRKWAEAKGLKPLAFTTFGKEFKKLGYTDDRLFDKALNKKHSVWENVKIDTNAHCAETTGIAREQAEEERKKSNSAFISKHVPVTSFTDLQIAKVHPQH